MFLCSSLDHRGIAAVIFEFHFRDYYLDKKHWSKYHKLHNLKHLNYSGKDTGLSVRRLGFFALVSLYIFDNFLRYPICFKKCLIPIQIDRSLRHGQCYKQYQRIFQPPGIFQKHIFLPTCSVLFWVFFFSPQKLKKKNLGTILKFC